MALLSAEGLRAAAREAIFSAGGRGFVRFGPTGGYLLVSDAPRRFVGAPDVLISALAGAGFSGRIEAGMLLIDPSDALLEEIAWNAQTIAFDWDGRLYAAYALADRLTRRAKTPLTPEGKRLILETLRLLWQPEDRVLAGLGLIRAQCAAMLRKKDYSGMSEAGCLLMHWCLEKDKEVTL